MNDIDILKKHEKIIKIWKHISGDNLIINNNEINTWIKLCKIHNFNFQYNYLKKLNIAYHYSKCRYHRQTKKSLLRAILDGERIYLNDYEEKKQNKNDLLLL